MQASKRSLDLKRRTSSDLFSDSIYNYYFFFVSKKRKGKALCRVLIIFKDKHNNENKKTTRSKVIRFYNNLAKKAVGQ